MTEINSNSEIQNNTVYLTESSYKQLVNRSDTEKFNLDDVKVIFNQIYDNWKFYKMFNKSDYKFLFKCYLLLKGEGVSLFYKEVEERKDDFSYVLELKGKLKYHLNPNCEKLNNGFRNFFMPEPIVNIEDNTRKSELVNEIRNWFKLNNFTILRYNNNEINDKILTNSFNNYFPSRFNIDKITISQSDNNQFKWYIEKTTNAVKLDYQFNIEEFNRNVNLIISDRNKLCKVSNSLYNLSKYDFLQSKPETEILEKLNESITNGYLKDVNNDYINQLGLENLISFWKQHIELKNRAKQEFIEILKWKFNLSELGLQNIQLENFNFECCSFCKGHKNRINTILHKTVRNLAELDG